MNTHEDLLNDLARLLADNSIGLDLLAARPRGNRLPEETRDSISAVLDKLDLILPVSTTGDAAADRSSALVYGNGCFSVRRYEAASETYRRLLQADHSDTSAGFNLGLCYLRLRRLSDAVDAFTYLLQTDPDMAEACLQSGWV